jgi:tetratricopeptide (TPR) repeat protein
MSTTAAKPRSVLAILFLLITVMAFACVSTEKRYKKGLALEAQGRLEEAAQRYIAVLAKEPGREEARQRLAEVGAQIVERDLDFARGAAKDGRFEEAADALLAIDGLRAQTDRVGVPLAVPDQYQAFRRDMVDAAATALFQRGEELEAAGRWPDAAHAYEKARSYPLNREQTLRADDSRARVFLRWAEQDMSLGSFRAAYGHAQTAVEVFGADSPTGTAGRAIQNAALDAGTKRVAILPFWAEPGAGVATPHGFETLLYDTLLYERMDQPPLFVGPIDRGAIHREMVRLKVRGGVLSDRTASQVGRALGADLVVTGWLGSYVQEDSPPEVIQRTTTLRNDRTRTVTFAEKRISVKVTGEVTIRLVDPVTRKALDEERVSAQVSGKFRRGSYDGEPGTLALDREERALFDREAWRREEEDLRKRLADHLAERTASVIFERVLRFVR